MKTALIAAGLLLAAGFAPALAQDGHDGHQMQSDAADSPSTRGFQEANERMHQDMAIEYTGDADVDFVRGMIPHHQGAIDMARVLLANGKDPELRRLAEGIIAAQEAEIAEMQAWLAAHAPEAGRPASGEAMPGMNH